MSTSYILTSVWRAPISPLQTSSIIIRVLWVLNLFWSKSMFTWHAKFTDEACAIRKRRRWRRRPPDYLVRNCTLERLYSLYPRIQSGSAVHVLVSFLLYVVRRPLNSLLQKGNSSSGSCLHMRTVEAFSCYPNRKDRVSHSVLQASAVGQLHGSWY